MRYANITRKFPRARRKNLIAYSKRNPHRDKVWYYGADSGVIVLIKLQISSFSRKITRPGNLTENDFSSVFYIKKRLFNFYRACDKCPCDKVKPYITRSRIAKSFEFQKRKRMNCVPV